jgi:lysozyme
MKTSQRGIDLIKKYEGFKTMPYKDIVGKLTVGYGHLVIAGDGIVAGSPITMGQATSLLIDDLNKAESAINYAVKVQLTQNQFDALVSFVYNLGTGAFAMSTLLKLINSGKFEDASKQFVLWDHAGKVEVEGLKRRRLEEATLFMEKQA